MDTGILIAVISPILLTIGGLVTWILKSKREELLTQEEKAREFRIKTYETLLEPYIGIFTFNLPDHKKEKEVQKMGSLDYKKGGL